MGNFYCIPNGCARVVFRRYESGGGIRYRYPGEDWVYVDGDDYTVSSNSSRIQIVYKAVVKFVYRFWNGDSNGGNDYADYFAARNATLVIKEEERKIIGEPFLTFNNGRLTMWGYTGSYELEYETVTGNILPIYFNSPLDLNRRKLGFDPTQYRYGAVLLDTVTLDSFTLFADYSSEQTNCILRVFKNGVNVLTKESNECPEVELLDDACQLSQTHEQITIEKLSYIEKVEVTDYGYLSPIGVTTNTPTTYPIPNSCLNIYKSWVYTPTPTDIVDYGAYTVSNIEYIAQICSPSGCPAPEYQVICDCDCESCPNGTCAIECDGHICCVDPQTGIGVTSIPIENYCEGA